MAQLSEETSCFCALHVGNYMYVAAKREDGFVNYRYHTLKNTWETLPSFAGLAKQISCLCSVDDHIYAMFQSGSPYRFHISTNQWQCVAKLSAQCNLPQSSFCNKAAVVFRSLIYVLHGRGDEYEVNRTFKHIHGFPTTWKPRVADLFCFDPKKNEWEQKASTSTSHFGSSLLVVNDKLYVAGGNCSIGKYNAEPCGGAGSVEVYDEKNNTWSVVDQPHIPPNNLGAIEVEGSVYFIINNFPVDSGIRIPPGEVYSVSLDEWEDLGRVHQNAIFCLVLVKTESLTSE